MTRHGSSVSAWVERFAPHIPEQGDVLDLACGGGRHLRRLRQLGRGVVGVDLDVAGVADLIGAAGVEIIAADLENGAGWPFPAERRFAAVVVANYLHRPLFPFLTNALAPGGLLIYETFAVGNEHFGRPRSPDFLLRPGELLGAAADADLTVVAYEHGFQASPTPGVTQRICAVRGESPLLSGL